MCDEDRTTNDLQQKTANASAKRDEHAATHTHIRHVRCSPQAQEMNLVLIQGKEVDEIVNIHYGDR